MRFGNFEIVRSPEGISRIRQLSSGELMHPLAEPFQESLTLYVEPTRLLERLAESCGTPLVVWDVGLGAGTNAMAAIRTVQEWARDHATQSRSLHVVSFEKHLESFQLAYSRASDFPHLLDHEAPAVFLSQGKWQSAESQIQWELIAGDFIETCLSAPRPEIIFYDPFSPLAQPELWGREVFFRIAQCARSGAVLSTYSAATRVRRALSEAGFRPERSPGLGSKRETTLAFLVS